ncbi:hypothetical protein [Xylophilus ampelinus]|uniref:hypothetical protein n=1 Tax=Xylophilus ampelinus TaxID=54067 RepID=UPI00216AC451|nr:hypothetical protein [Xylophilus ampelinus]MCS4511942.1 hypothetical protein [Xylophilus ampelinus]
MQMLIKGALLREGYWLTPLAGLLSDHHYSGNYDCSNNSTTNEQPTCLLFLKLGLANAECCALGVTRFLAPPVPVPIAIV